MCRKRHQQCFMTYTVKRGKTMDVRQPDVIKKQFRSMHRGTSQSGNYWDTFLSVPQAMLNQQSYWACYITQTGNISVFWCHFPGFTSPVVGHWYFFLASKEKWREFTTTYEGPHLVVSQLKGYMVYRPASSWGALLNGVSWWLSFYVC